MKDSEYGASDEYQQMMDQFDELMQNALRQQKDDMDIKYLDLKRSSLETDKTVPFIKNTLKSLETEWEEMNQAYHVPSGECSDISKCTISKRVKFILLAFKDYFVSKYINNASKDDQVDFVNDIFLDIFTRNSDYNYWLIERLGAHQGKPKNA